MPHPSFAINEIGGVGPLSDLELLNVPKTLYAAGAIYALEEDARVAIVGTSDPSHSAWDLAWRLGASLRRRSNVVTGGTIGVQTAARKAAFIHGSRWIAVLPTPINERIPEETGEGWRYDKWPCLMLSPYPPGMTRDERNPLLQAYAMAVLSDATVIIDARDGSRAVAQGWEALRIGRPVFIPKKTLKIPGLKWPERMLERGARVLDNRKFKDLFDILPSRYECEIPF